MKNKWLIVLFVALLVIYGLTRIFPGKRERNFNPNLIQIDTSQVTSVIISPKDGNTKITLTRGKGGWTVTNGQINAQASMGSVNALLANIMEITANQLVARKSDKWGNYNVREGQGTRVQVYHDQKLLDDFIVGKFDYNQQANSLISYVRLSDKNEVYGVEGYLSMNVSGDFDDFRDKTILKMQSPMEVTEFDWQGKGADEQFLKTPKGWMLGTEKLDSSKVENYLNALRNISGSAFADDFNKAQSEQLLYKTLTIKGKNINEPFVISCYRDDTRKMPFVIHSDQNPDVYFASDSTGVYSKIFKEVNDFRSK